MTLRTLTTRAVLALLVPAALAACGGNSTTGPDVAQADIVAQSLASGTWAITTYVQGTEDKAGAFSDYRFTFTKTSAKAGTVTATSSKNGDVVHGSWSHQAAVTYYGSSSKESVTLNFPGNSAWARVSKLWNVSTSSSSSLELASPELVEAERLTFSRR